MYFSTVSKSILDAIIRVYRIMAYHLYKEVIIYILLLLPNSSHIVPRRTAHSSAHRTGMRNDVQRSVAYHYSRVTKLHFPIPLSDYLRVFCALIYAGYQKMLKGVVRLARL